MFHRLINPIKSNSFFIFGARGTGKTMFLQTFFKEEPVLWFDLLEPQTWDILSRRPDHLADEVRAQQEKISWVIIDEVQKAPPLLDLVHLLIESTPVKFALTGSSARKLKHGSANLLAGRAFVNQLFPLTHLEMKEQFNLLDAMQWGTLPKISSLKSDEEKQAFLASYALTYLKEEVWEEHIIRKLDPFRRFLEIAAQTNGEIVNYTNISKDVGADVKTIQSYFQILEDTLLGFLLESHHRSIRKQQRVNPKFYFFDTGIQRALSMSLTQKLLPNTYVFGKTFEHFLIIEIYRLNQYLKKDYRLSYLRSKDHAEIDLIIEEPSGLIYLVEIKSSTSVDDRDVRTLRRFLSEFPTPKTKAFIFSLDPRPKIIDNIPCLPWMQGLREIGLF